MQLSILHFEVIACFSLLFSLDVKYLGDDYIQNFHFERYIAG